MLKANQQAIAQAKAAALQVLLYNAQGPYDQIPRTAGWGYPEPYTRDLLLSILGIAATGNQQLENSMGAVLETLAKNQTERGHIPSLVHDKQDCGSSDATPLFLLGVGIYRKMKDIPDFLEPAVRKALTWMEYQSPSDRYLVAQQPTSDWRDEQWVLGYGLFVNALTYSYLRILDEDERAEHLRHEIHGFTITTKSIPHHVHEGLMLKDRPYYALWSYKVLHSDRFDLLGNSLAILSGIASESRAEEMIAWIEAECKSLKKKGELKLDLPPNFFPYIQPKDLDWHPRYTIYNNPGDYHNGGIWPFICGFYIAALVAAQKYDLAEEKLMALTQAVKMVNSAEVEYGFNEWIKAQDGQPKGQDWQSWSAALYLYAAQCVEERKTPFFDEMRLHASTYV